MPQPEVEESTNDSFAWNTLLEAIANNKVIPVVGRSLSAWPEDADHRTFDEKVAAELATRLGKKFPNFKHDVETRTGQDTSPLFTEDVTLLFRLSRGHQNNDAYEAFSESLAAVSKAELRLPVPLQTLAQIETLDFFLDVTFDDFLERALIEARPKKNVKASSGIGSGVVPNQPEPAHVQVHHLFGYKGDFEIFDDMRVRVILDLQRKLENEFADLGKRIRGRTLLFLGCGLPDWLMHFFVLALLDVSADGRNNDSRRSVKLADASVLDSRTALVVFLESMEVDIYKCGTAHDFVKELAKRWQKRRDGAIPTPRIGAKVVLSCHKDDLTFVEPEAARLKVWGIDTEVLRSDQPIESVNSAIEACSIYVACISAHSIGLTPQERDRLFPEWSFARARKATAGGAFSAYCWTIADEAKVANEVKKTEHPLNRWSKRQGQELAIQLIEPLRKAGIVTLRGRTGPKGADEPLVVYCIYGKADWDGDASRNGVDDLLEYLKTTFRSTPWLKLNHQQALLPGTEIKAAILEADALLLFSSPAVDLDPQDPICQVVQEASEHPNQAFPLYSVPFRKMDASSTTLDFVPLDLGDKIDVVSKPFDQTAQDVAWAAVARALWRKIVDDYLNVQAPPTK